MKRQKNKSENTFKRLFKYLGKYKGRIIFAVIITFFAVAAYAFAPLAMGIALNELGAIFTNPESEDAINQFFIFMLTMTACYIVYAVFSYIANRIIISATQRAVYDLRLEIDHKISKLPLNYYDTTTYGDILARLTNDVETISQSFQQTVFEVIKASFTVVLVFILMVCVSGWLTLVALIAIPFALIIAGKITKKSEVKFDTQMKKTGELNGYVEEYYSGHNVVTLFGKEKQVNQNFDNINKELYEASSEGTFMADLLSPILQGANNLGYTLVCFFGALIAIVGSLSVGMIQAFAQFLNQFATAITTVMQLSSQIQQTKAASKRVFAFLDEQEEIPDTKTPIFPEVLKGKVEFNHVKFGYVPHQILMHDLNEVIKPGQKAAIVGPTGAGKTTLVNLIMRFYDVTDGSIKIDGVDIRDMKRADLRNIFGMVLQDTWLYSGSIMDNIRYGNLKATDAEVIAAAKAACADDFIQTLPGGYHFILTEGASNIAQGQRQLITIARAMLNNPPIMILDEATSSVDTRTEALIQTAMVNMTKGKTSFVIAHRLSTIKDSDKILYMEKGDVLEVGTHDELMALNGKYAKLYNSQFAD